MRRSIMLGLVPLSAVACLWAGAAQASNILEFPDNGSEQMGRGGAWVARASDPLAAAFNPAGLAGQDTRLTLQANINFAHTCFTRQKGANDLTSNDGVMPGGTYPKVCNSGSAFPNPQLAFAYKINERLTIGLAVLGPSAAGQTTWPEFATTSSGATIPGPQRYLLIRSNVLLFEPTLGVGWEPIDRFRIGGAFIFGTAPTLDFANASAATNQTADPGANDVRAELATKKGFIPGFNLGVLWSPTNNLDVAGWYKYMSPITASGADLHVYSYYFTPQVAGGNTGTPVQSGLYGNAANIRVPIPMEAKLGLRYHEPRAGVVYNEHRRDPIAQDAWDVEVDGTWAHDSQFKSIDINFPQTLSLQTVGIPGNLPPSASVPHEFKDVFGIRAGGDWNVLPDQLAPSRRRVLRDARAGSAVPEHRLHGVVAPRPRRGRDVPDPLRQRRAQAPDRSHGGVRAHVRRHDELHRSRRYQRDLGRRVASAVPHRLGRQSWNDYQLRQRDQRRRLARVLSIQVS